MLFRDLSPSAKIVYHVIRRIKNHKTESFFHSTQKIADIAGISLRSCKYALDELIRQGILKATERPGHTTLYTFISTADLAQFCTPTVQDLHPTRAEFAPITTSALTNSDLTTTWLSDFLFSKAIKLHGKEWTDVVVDRISRMNGNIKDKGAYFNWCIQTNIIPTSKELKAQEAKEKHKKYIDEQIEKSQRENEERERIWSERDPEAGNKAITELISKINEADKK